MKDSARVWPEEMVPPASATATAVMVAPTRTALSHTKATFCDPFFYTGDEEDNTAWPQSRSRPGVRRPVVAVQSSELLMPAEVELPALMPPWDLALGGGAEESQVAAGGRGGRHDKAGGGPWSNYDHPHHG